MQQDSAPLSQVVGALFLRLIGVASVLFVVSMFDLVRTHVYRDLRVARQVVDVFAQEGGGAIALWQDSFDTYWLDLVDAEGDLIWRAAVGGRPLELGGRWSVTSNASSVFVHYVGDGQAALRMRAFRRRDGAVSWDAQTTSLEGESLANAPYSSVVPDVIATEDAVVAVTTFGGQAVILDAGSGRVVERVAAPEYSSFRPAYRDRSDVLLHGGRVFAPEILRVAKAGMSVTPGDVACKVGGALLTLDNTNGEPVVTRGDGATVILNGFSGFVRRCASYDGHLVALAVSRANELTVVAWKLDGTLLYAVPLGEAFQVFDQPTMLSPHGVFEGELTRFAPFGAERMAMGRLLMIDLAEGRIAWRSTATEAPQLLRSGTHWFMVERRTGRIAMFDGTTGRLEKAVAPRDGDLRLDPTAVEDGTLWLRRESPVGIAEDALYHLDARTLQSHDAGLGVRDVTEELRRDLGIP